MSDNDAAPFAVTALALNTTASPALTVSPVSYHLRQSPLIDQPLVGYND